MKVAVMQPYFFPYAGYYRLFIAADLFVLYDCVQFPRRGWVHRNKFMRQGQEEWITLPIQKCPRDTVIADLEFRDDAQAWHQELLYNHPKLYPVSEILAPCSSVMDYLDKTLTWTRNKLELPCDTIRSSSLNIDRELKGQDRILAICEQVGATKYINLSGGTELYNEKVFRDSGIDLKFLTPYMDNYDSMLLRMISEPLAKITQEIKLNTS